MRCVNKKPITNNMTRYLTGSGNSIICPNSETPETIQVRAGQTITVPPGSTSVVCASCIGTKQDDGSIKYTFTSDGTVTIGGSTSYEEVDELPSTGITRSLSSGTSKPSTVPPRIDPSAEYTNPPRMDQMQKCGDNYHVVYFPNAKLRWDKRAWLVTLRRPLIYLRERFVWTVRIMSCAANTASGDVLPPVEGWDCEMKQELVEAFKLTASGVESDLLWQLRQGKIDAAKEMLHAMLEDSELQDWLGDVGCGKETANWKVLAQTLVKSFIELSQEWMKQHPG